MKTKPVVVALLVALAAVTAGTGAGAGASDGGVAMTDAAPTEAAAPQTGTNTNASNASLGASISSFMQASEADADATVDNGLFAAKFNDSNASERARLVQQRVAGLEGRIADLQQEREAFNPTADNTVNVSERAKAARLAARANGLVIAINQTEAAVDRADIPVNETKLDLLRNEARHMTGQEVAAVTTGLVDIDRPGPAQDRPGADQNQADTRTGN